MIAWLPSRVPSQAAAARMDPEYGLTKNESSAPGFDARFITVSFLHQWEDEKIHQIRNQPRSSAEKEA